jgi:hypothetical protein
LVSFGLSLSSGGGLIRALGVFLIGEVIMRWSFAAIGFLYAIIYAVFAFAAAGAGHGTGIFFAAIWPYGLGLLFFPVVGFLAGDLKPFLPKVLFISLLVIHYTLAINFLRLGWTTDLPYIEKMWDNSPLYILLPAGFYLLGQVLIWAAFIRTLNDGNRYAA